LAKKIQGPIPRSAQTIALQETTTGTTPNVTQLGVGGKELQPWQRTLAEDFGIKVGPQDPDLHAEVNAVNNTTADELLPTDGVATNKPCGNTCNPFITEIGVQRKVPSKIDGNYWSFPQEGAGVETDGQTVLHVVDDEAGK
jgi:hypothetical protein